MNRFTEFVISNHPDPDHLFGRSVEEAWDEICRLADEYIIRHEKGKIKSKKEKLKRDD